MKKVAYFLIALILVTAAVYFMASLYRKGFFSKNAPSVEVKDEKKEAHLEEGLKFLRLRKDKEALAVFEQILLFWPDNPDALWGKAEVLRRRRDYQSAEGVFKEVLKNSPRHIPSLTSMAYIRYKEDRFDQALAMINGILKEDSLDRQNRALCFLLLGAINSRRAEKGGLLSKVKYGTKIRGYFLKAFESAPDMPEAHLGLGAFYMLAPAIIGGNTEKAFSELSRAVEMAPDFATANARLAQYYKKKGELDKFEIFSRKAKELDPDNEVLKEIAGNL